MTTETIVIRETEPQPSIDIPGALWRGRWIIVAATLVGLVLAIFMLSILPRKYTAFLQLVPMEQSGAALNRNISGLASLAGINLPRGQASQFTYVLEVMKGADTAAAVARDQSLMHRLFPSQWNARERRWQQPDSALRPYASAVKSLLSMPQPAWHPPGKAELQTLVQRRLMVGEDPKKALVTLSFDDRDPTAARDLLVALHKAADGQLRARALDRTQANIQYLSMKLRTVDLAEHREALATALAEQERVLMTASVTGLDFAADELGSASVTDLPTSPNTLLVLASGLGGGMALGAAMVLGLAWRRQRA